MRRAIVVIAGLAALAAHADTLGPAPGNALNPTPPNPSTGGRWMFEEGLGTRIPAARTPSGLLYNIPLDPGDEVDEKARPEWVLSGFAEGGAMLVKGDGRGIGFLNYKDIRNGAYLNVFALGAERPREATFIELSGGAAGLDDQFYLLQAGRYNDWKVRAFFEGTPQVFTTTYRSLWNGVGTDNLTLRTLTPGGTANAATTQANIQAALAATELSTLEVVRRKAGVQVDKKLSESWKVFASFTSESRQGARPFGAVFGGGGGGGNIEIAETIDYLTQDLAAGAQFSDALSSLNVRVSASLFHNNVDTMRFQDPLFITLNGSSGLAATTFKAGRFDLVPDNAHYNVKGEYARVLPWLMHGAFTATVAAGTMRQDDGLVAPTELALTGGTVTAGGASLANAWNTTGALSRQTADARIDTLLADVGLAVKPSSALDMKAKVRFYETDNATQYLACNPLTGQWGRILNDGSGLSIVGANTTAGANPAGTSANAYNTTQCSLAATRALNLVPSTGNVPIAAVPNDYRQVNASLAADYRLGRSAGVNASFEREVFRRDYRERETTHEDKVKVGYVDRALADGTLRISYEYARRGGSGYNPNPYLPFQSASFGPDPAANGVAVQSWFHSIDQFRSFDIADRRQGVLNARVNYAFHPTLDAAMTLQLKDADFPGEFGRTGRQRSDSLTLDLGYQAGSKAEVYGFYSLQAASMGQRGIAPNNCVIGSTYYFYSDGEVISAADGAAAPATPAGTTLIGTQAVSGTNWRDVCAGASATSPLFPSSRAWQVDSRDRNHVIGLGFKYDFGFARLDTQASHSLGRTRIAYAYNPAALGLSPLQAALAGSGWSDLKFAQTILDASVWIPLQKDVSLRLLARFEAGRVRDWHYDGVALNPLPANASAYLDAGPQDYRTTAIGVFIQVRM
jgi:hypothetical protein